jgi:hypothetical protein
MFMVRKRTGDSKFNDLRGDVKVGSLGLRTEEHDQPVTV